MNKNCFHWQACMLLGLCLYLSACCKPANVGSQPVPLISQQTNNWCWAATTQMITTFLGHGVQQCDLANQRFGRTDCCTGNCPKNSACNMPGWTMFSESGFDFRESVTPLPWDSITKYIYCRKQPLAYAYGPKSGGVGHVLVIYGYASIGSTNYLFLRDPWAPCEGNDRPITYEEYSNSGSSDHWRTMFDFKFR